METERSFLSYFKYVSGVCLAAVVIMMIAGYRASLGPAVITMFTSLALYFTSHPFLKRFAFTIWVFAFASASIAYPESFIEWGGFELKNTITPLIQIIMFGMGTTLSLRDFSEVLRRPWPILVGFGSQFVIMPLVGWALASGLILGKAFGLTPESFTPEIAAGIVLIGCCPSGVASNVMTYLSGGDVAVSVTVTSSTTLVAPFMTPILMKTLGGQMVEVHLVKMMFEIINMIIVPIVAGLLANRILYSRRKAFQQGWLLSILSATGVAGAILAVRFVPAVLFTWGKGQPYAAAFPRAGVIFGLTLLSLVVLSQLVIRVWFKGPERWMDRVLPIVSMLGICCIIAVITARSIYDLSGAQLKGLLPFLFAATVIHNALGYCLGYWLARACRLNERVCRAVAFEVGMQNGGMASGLAMNVIKSSAAALAPAFFGPWQNVSGSILATWWHRKPVVVKGTPGTEPAGLAAEA
jgi:BASS family bile acid:Na+ symporter